MIDPKEGLLDHDFDVADEAIMFEKPTKLFTSPITKIILALSFATNIILILGNYSKPSTAPVSKSRYGTSTPKIKSKCMPANRILAGLLNNLEVPFVWDTDRSNPNDTERNKLWYDDGESNEGIMAVDNVEAEIHGLQQSQQWPWDKKKSIYITNGHHNMHCLVSSHSLLSKKSLIDNQPEKHLYFITRVLHRGSSVT
jgi:hypothetical protein